MNVLVYAVVGLPLYSQPPSQKYISVVLQAACSEERERERALDIPRQKLTNQRRERHGAGARISWLTGDRNVFW